MAANLGQAFLGAGMVSTLAQELAAGNFHENRESFHDYIYSKLILGDDKGNNPIVSSSNPPVFPNTNLASSYPNPLPVVGSPYNQGSNNGSHSVVDNGGDGSSAGEGSKVFNVSSLTKASSGQKPGSSKKKSSQAQQNMTQQICPGSGEDLTKLKKKSHHKKKEKTHVCDVCARGFAEKYTLNRHMMTHTHVKPYSCTKCNMSFSRSDGLAKHMAAGHRRIDAHHCDVCGGTFNSEVSFEQHRREYGNTLPFVCNLCMLAFSQCCHLNYHMKSHSLSKVNDSYASDSVDDKSNAIDVSELIPDDFSPPKKEVVKNSFSGLLFTPPKSEDVYAGRRNDDHSLGLLDHTVVIKPEIEDYPNCQAITNQMSRSNAGQVSSLANSSFDAVNNYPTVTSSSTASLDVPNSHADSNLTSNNSVNTPSYIPDTSGSLNSSSSSETVPISEAEMKKYLNIKIPNPRFLDSSLLQGAAVSEDGLFRCEICGKGFTRKYHMQRHVKLHIRGPVPKAHLLDWTRRPYACGVCKMGFTRQHHLTRHMLIHTGERPHSCHVCGKAFRRFTNLTLHVRTVHGAERPFKCHICSRGFPRLYSLQRHLKLHAKNAAGLSSDSADQLYKGFKSVVGTVSVDKLSEKSPSYGSANPGHIKESPGHGQETVSSEYSDGSERFKQESSAHDDSVEQIDPDGNGSPVTNRDRGVSIQEENRGASFHSQSDVHRHSKDHTLSSLSSQANERIDQPGHAQQVMSPPDSDIRVQNNRIVSSNNDSIIRPNSVQASREFVPSPRPSSEPVGSQPQLQTRNAASFSQPQSMQNTSSERFMPINAILAQSMRTIDMSGGRNFNELDIRESNSYSLSQRVSSADGFILHQGIQSPHPLINSLERPGSRSMMSQASGSDTYHQSQAVYIQSSSLLTQQRASMDLSSTHTTLSSAGLRDPGVYSHNHHVDMGGSRTGISDPPAYSHSHSVNSMSFPGGVHGVYQQQLSDNLNHLDMHPNPSASPMPISSHSNNIQY